jgi:hypothetical protein
MFRQQMPAAGRCPQDFANSVAAYRAVWDSGRHVDGRRRASQDQEQEDTVSGMGALKAAVGNCTPSTDSLFVSDIPRR